MNYAKVASVTFSLQIGVYKKILVISFFLVLKVKNWAHFLEIQGVLAFHDFTIHDPRKFVIVF